jgi:hypothetical protein
VVKEIKPPHEITSIKETLIQVCNKRINYLSIITFLKGILLVNYLLR